MSGKEAAVIYFGGVIGVIVTSVALFGWIVWAHPTNQIVVGFASLLAAGVGLSGGYVAADRFLYGNWIWTVRHR